MSRLGALFQQFISVAAVTVALLFLANWAAEKYLVANPAVLLSPEELTAEQFRNTRESLTRGHDEKVWFGLPDEAAIKEMWDEYYSAGAKFESYVHFRTRAVMGKYYRVTDAGYRETREQGPWPPDPKNFNVLFFGGSTSFGVGPHFGTVASFLQDALGTVDGRKVYVYNFGRTSYFSTQERVLFQQLLTEGTRADMAVFLDGLNDFCFRDGKPSNWQLLEHLYNKFHDDYLAQARGNGVGTRWPLARDFFTTLPIVRLAGAAATRATSGPLPTYATKPATTIGVEPSPPQAELDKVMDRYYANVKQIAAIGSAFGTETFFVWQPIPTYKYDVRHTPFVPDRLYCHTGSKYGYPQMKERVAKESPSANRFFWLADMQEDLKEALYVDTFHYTSPMSRRIGELIAANIRQAGHLRPRAAALQ